MKLFYFKMSRNIKKTSKFVELISPAEQVLLTDGRWKILGKGVCELYIHCKPQYQSQYRLTSKIDIITYHILFFEKLLNSSETALNYVSHFATYSRPYFKYNNNGQ